MKLKRPGLFEMAKWLAQLCCQPNESTGPPEEVSEKYLRRKELEFSERTRRLGEFFGFCRALYMAGIFKAADLIELQQYAFPDLDEHRKSHLVTPEIISFINGLGAIDELGK